MAARPDTATRPDLLVRPLHSRVGRPVAALAALMALALSGCPKPSQTETPTTSATSAPKPKPTGGGPSIRSEVGALDKEAVEKLVKAALPTIDRCVAARRKQLPFLGGSVEAVIRSDSQGKVRWAHISESELGDRDTEKCVLDALSAQKWPEPQGGEDGLTHQRIDLGVPDEREPTPWTTDDLQDAGPKLVSALDACRQQSGTASLTVTFFIDPSGSAKAVGVATGDEKGIDAVDCAIKAVKAGRYPTPGSYPAKVTAEVR